MHKEKFSGKVESFWGRPITELKFKEGHPQAGEFNTVATLKFEDVEYDTFGPAKPLASYGDDDWSEAYDEMAKANELPTKEDIVKVANNKRKQAARQKAMLAQVTAAGLQQPNLDNDELMVLETIYKGLRAAKIGHDEAKVTAATLSKFTWPEGKPEVK